MQQTLLLLAAGQGTLLSLALLSSWFKSDYFRFFIGLTFFVITLEIWTYWGFEVGYIQSDPSFPYWSLGSYLWLAPSINYILRYLSNPTQQVSKLDYLSLIPGTVEVILNFFNFYTVYFFHFALLPNSNILLTFITEQLPIIWIITVLIMRFPVKASTRFTVSYILFFLLILLWTIDYAFPGSIFVIVKVFLVSTLFGFGYLAYLRPRSFDAPKYSRLDVQFGKFDHSHHVKEMDKYLRSEKGFLQPQFSIKDLAKALNVSSKYVSYLINKTYHINFRQYLNRLRVENVKQRIDQGELKNKTLLGIALDAGFNSKASFNSVFKSITGENPSEYIKRNQRDGKKG